jgi:hypothetical protein
MSMAARISVVDLMRAGINALAHADAMGLGGLAEAARTAGRPQTPQEHRIAREGLRTLGMLLTLTRRNLRLLRGNEGYGSPRA